MNRAMRFAVLLTTVFSFAASLQADDLKVETVFIRLSADVDVPARAAGELDDIAVKEGDMVSRGQMLGHIEESTQKVEVDRKRLDVMMARLQAENRAALDFAQKESAVYEEQLTRAQNSRDALKSSISLKELESIKLAHERAAHDVTKFKHELDVADLMRQFKETEVALAEQQLERHRIISPTDGIVSAIDREPGEWVQPGERVFRIVRLDMLRAEGFINARDAIDNVNGARVTLTIDVPSKEALQYQGQIVFVDPDVEPATSQVRVRAVFPNEGLRVRPGMRASMVIHRSNTEDSNAGEAKPATAIP